MIQTNLPVASASPPPRGGGAVVPAGPVTLADIAARCKLSKASVSRALSMTEEDCPLSPTTRTRVRRVAAEMGYRVNVQARALASGRSMTIGLLYGGTMPFLNHIYQEIVEAFSATLRGDGYHLVMLGIDQEGQWEDWLLGGRLDGVMCLHAVPEEVDRLPGPLRLPLVLLNGRSDRVSGSVSVDDRAGAGLITRHLLGLGHRRLLLFTDTGHETPHHSIADRRAGFLAAAAEAGLSPAEARCFEGGSVGFAEAWEAMDPKPTAVIGYSHVEAIRALGVLQRAGVDVPGACSLATFNDVFPVADLNPALTCVAIRPGEIGRTGGRILLDLLRRPNARRGAGGAFVLDTDLIVRESTAPPGG